MIINTRAPPARLRVATQGKNGGVAKRKDFEERIKRRRRRRRIKVVGLFLCG